jgi:hypothetical protein
MSTNSTNEPTQLQTNHIDYVSSAAKAMLGMVPFAGSLLAELAGSVIPNQRIDRLSKFAIQLEARLATLDQAFVRAQLLDENFTDLLEDGVRQAARSLSDERRQYLAALLGNGISSDAISFAESKHLLRILGELADVEVIWLRLYLNPEIGGDSEFRTKHDSILKPIVPTMGSGQETIDSYALQSSYKEHLSMLGLLSPRYEIDSRTKQPIFDNRTGNLKLKGYEITPLGRLLLRQIALASEPGA